MPGLTHYLIVAVILFGIGALGMLLRRNVIVLLMCIELMLNAINLMLVAFSKFNYDLNGQIMVFFIMVLAACEAAVGLALVISIFKHYKSVDTKNFIELRG